MSSAESDLRASMDPPAPTGRAVHKVARQRVLVMLIRRELWEHRVLWLMPAAIALVLILFTLLGHVGSHGGTVHFDSKAGGPHALALWSLIQWGQTLPQYVAMVIVLNFYLLDCLYAERRDRSILFWKSLPVSDGATVAAKLLVALVIVPLGVFALTAVTDLVLMGLWHLRSALGQAVPQLDWNLLSWLKVEGLMLGGLLISILWYAPFAGYLLLVSAWARRSPIGWATLAPLLLVWAESLALGTHYVSQFFRYRMWGIWDTVHLEAALQHAVIRDVDTLRVALDRVYDAIELHRALTSLDLWLGVAATLALAVAAARIRRYRDDS